MGLIPGLERPHMLQAGQACGSQLPTLYVQGPGIPKVATAMRRSLRTTVKSGLCSPQQESLHAAINPAQPRKMQETELMPNLS